MQVAKIVVQEIPVLRKHAFMEVSEILGRYCFIHRHVRVVLTSILARNKQNMYIKTE